MPFSRESVVEFVTASEIILIVLFLGENKSKQKLFIPIFVRIKIIRLQSLLQILSIGGRVPAKNKCE